MTSKLSVQLFKQLYSCPVEERQKYSPHLVYHHTFESYMEGRARRKIKFYKIIIYCNTCVSEIFKNNFKDGQFKDLSSSLMRNT